MDRASNTACVPSGQLGDSQHHDVPWNCSAGNAPPTTSLTTTQTHTLLHQLSEHHQCTVPLYRFPGRAWLSMLILPDFAPDPRPLPGWEWSLILSPPAMTPSRS
jgi:hypothetical protein